MVRPVMWTLLALYGATLAVLSWQRQNDIVDLLCGTVTLCLIVPMLWQDRVRGRLSAGWRWVLIVSAVLVSAGLLEVVLRILRA